MNIEFKRPQYKDGEPCKHVGCLNHVSHPCEGCGRIAGRTKRNPTEQSEGADQPLLVDGHGLAIKFSHKYLKLSTDKEFKEAQLIEALMVDIETLSKTFLDYDTDEGTFVLPERGKFFLLIFKTEHGHVFTTLRRFNEKTIDKYKRNIGEWFDIIILNDFQVI